MPEEHVASARVDAPLPILHDQVTMQPPLVAQMVDTLALTGSENVVLFSKRDGAPVSLRVRTGARSVPLVGTYGFLDEL